MLSLLWSLHGSDIWDLCRTSQMRTGSVWCHYTHTGGNTRSTNRPTEDKWKFNFKCLTLLPNIFQQFICHCLYASDIVIASGWITPINDNDSQILEIFQYTKNSICIQNIYYIYWFCWLIHINRHDSALIHMDGMLYFFQRTMFWKLSVMFNYTWCTGTKSSISVNYTHWLVFSWFM